MSAKVEMKGLSELRSALRQLPAELAREADVIVLAQAEEAGRSIEAGYPEGPTGNLKAGIRLERNTSKFGTSAIVRNRAKHGWIFEKGTGPRRTASGANRGQMPKADPSEAFIPKAIRARKRMVSALVDLVRRAGFEVNA